MTRMPPGSGAQDIKQRYHVLRGHRQRPARDTRVSTGRNHTGDAKGGTARAWEGMCCWEARMEVCAPGGRFSNRACLGAGQRVPWAWTTGWICGALRASKGCGILFVFSSVIPHNSRPLPLPRGVSLGCRSAARHLAPLLQGLWSHWANPPGANVLPVF